MLQAREVVSRGCESEGTVTERGHIRASVCWDVPFHDLGSSYRHLPFGRVHQAKQS